VKTPVPEFALAAVFGILLVGFGNNLMWLFVGLELASVSTSFMLCRGNDPSRLPRPVARDGVFSLLASSLLLIGLGLLYGAAGTMRLEEMATRLNTPDAASGVFHPFVPPAFLLIFLGLGFTIAAVPFHGSRVAAGRETDLLGAGFLAVVPKAAGFLALVRLTVPMTSPAGLVPAAWLLVATVAAASMAFGHGAALGQNQLRRWLPYMSSGHAGFMLVGLALGLGSQGSRAQEGYESLLIYLLAYSVATMGILAAWIYLSTPEKMLRDMNELAGLGRSHPVAAGCLTLFGLSLVGLPPLIGFWPKYRLLAGVFTVAMETSSPAATRLGFGLLFATGGFSVVATAVACSRMLRVMYFRVPLAVPKGAGGRGAWFTMIGCAVLVVVLGGLTALPGKRELSPFPQSSEKTGEPPSPVCPGPGEAAAPGAAPWNNPAPCKASGGNRYPEEKVAGTFCAKHPKGRPGKRCLPPFPQGGKFVFAARLTQICPKGSLPQKVVFVVS